MLLGVLAIAPTRTHFTEWREIQQRYNVLARRAKLEPIDVHVRQVSSPIVDGVDRCGSCHLGAAGLPAVSGDPLFAAHPPIPHDPARFGCTVCHGGQGRAVTKRAAHEGEANFQQRLFPAPYREAGCGTCHAYVPTPNPGLVTKGREAFVARGCPSCHSVDGSAPKGDLSRIGLRDFARDWPDVHVRLAATSRDTRWGASVLLFEEVERGSIDAYLHTLIGAPRLMEGKLLVARLGCRGCHRIGKVGGDGPDLSEVGGRQESDVDFSRVRGEHTVATWMRELLLDPSRLDAHSRMPTPELKPAEVDAVVTYLLSLRPVDMPIKDWPRDRIQVVALGGRDFADDGAMLFTTFCSGCHGARGEGGTIARGAVRGPAIGGQPFLAIATDAFVRDTMRQGRTAHRMPAWASESGLRSDELGAIVRYLRTLEPEPPSLEAVTSSEVDVALGQSVFAESCAPCHGARGEGSPVAPPLAAADNPVTRSANAIYGTLAQGVSGTAMGSFRSLDARTMRSVIAHVMTLERAPGATRTGWAPRAGDSARGRELFDRHCARCHLVEGSGAPAILDPSFASFASDAFVEASIVRRHDRRVEALRRSPDEIADLAAYVTH